MYFNFDYEKVLDNSGCKFDSLEDLLIYVKRVLERMSSSDKDLQRKIDILNGVFSGFYIE